MKVASPTGGRFGSVKAWTCQVPVGAPSDVIVTSITGCTGTASAAFQGTAACGP